MEAFPFHLVSVSAIPYCLKPAARVPLRKKDMTSQLPQETIELYERILETYKEELKIDPNYSFVKHCSKWNANGEKVRSWLNRRCILISDLKNKAQELKSAQMFREAQQRGMFAQVHPETEAMSGWRSTEIPRVDIYLPGKVRLCVKKSTAMNIMALISTYAEKGGRH